MAITTPRASWKGSVSLGLMNVPVKLCTCVQTSKTSLSRVVKRGDSYEKVVQVLEDASGKPVANDEVEQAIETGNGYIVITPEELASVASFQDKMLKIDRFVPEKEIDPVMFDKPYYAYPDKGGEEGYALLVAAMKKTKKAAVATYVNRTKEYVVVLRPRGNVLLAQIIYYPTELVPNEEIASQLGQIKVNPEALKLAISLIDQVSGEFEPERYTNRAQERFNTLIASKARGEAIKLVEKASEAAPTTDLLATLQASLDAQKKPKKEKVAS